MALVYRPLKAPYCDTFLVYDICAKDLNRDVVMEYVYFLDDHKVFTYREGTEEVLPKSREMYRCALLWVKSWLAPTFAYLMWVILLSF